MVGCLEEFYSPGALAIHENHRMQWKEAKPRNSYYSFVLITVPVQFT